MSSLRKSILFSNDQLGLGFWDAGTHHVTWITYQDGFLKKDWIYSLYEDDQYVWIGYAHSGAQRVEKKWLYDQLKTSRRKIEQVVDAYGKNYDQLKAGEVHEITQDDRTSIPAGNLKDVPEYMLKLTPSMKNYEDRLVEQEKMRARKAHILNPNDGFVDEYKSSEELKKGQ